MTRHESVQTKLRQFHSSFGHAMDLEYPTAGREIDRQKELRRKLIQEEYQEVINAIDTENADNVLKELCDLVYVCIGFATTYGWSFDTAFNRVHKSNMSKLDKEGNPVYRGDGKVLKSSSYEPPKLKDLI